jgi:serine/threonine protein kinase
VTESLVWLVLEYCPGDELYNHLLSSGPMSPDKVQKIFTQLIGAVSYVHQKSCVHRDLKLENILLDKKGDVKLVDFGFTREYEGKSSYLQTWCGTVCYSAPEMLKGEKYAGEKVDVWSLGIILYALLCGELPFDEDDEEVTKQRILKEEPKFPDHVPQQARDLINVLLSKRPLLRPSLADILQHPWLSEHAPRQQEILKLQQPAPFTTELEKETLERMRSAGVDIDMVIEHVLSQRCDSLAGWWALLIEKEERKARRRERKRKEREAEAKSLRRLSAASSRLDRIAPTIRELDEEHLSVPIMADPPKSRGRTTKRASSTAPAPDLPRLAEASSTNLPDSNEPPTPVDKDSIRSTSHSRPPPPPKENGRQPSSLQVVSAPPDEAGTSPDPTRPRRLRFNTPLLSQLASLKHWFKESAKRAKSPHSKPAPLPQNLPQLRPRPNVRRYSTASTASYRYSNSHTLGSAASTVRGTSAQRPSVLTNGAAMGHKARTSLSPSPLTPHSSYRRSVSGLRGRKSTSSSLSSVRSIHHVHTHSKASSTSSTNASLASPTGSHNATTRLRSPHSSVKVLPATPTGGSFPSSLRLARTPLSLSHGEGTAAFSALPPPSPGLPVFAKRKRSVFKGPMLTLPHLNSGRRESQGSRSNSVQGRRSGEIIEEEEEEDEEVEEVEEFSPVRFGEVVLEEGPPPLTPLEEKGGGLGTK